MKDLKTGNFTIEAALIMPIVIFITIALIFFGYYMHDYAVLQGIADDMALKSARILPANNYILESQKDNTLVKVVYSDLTNKNLYWRFFTSIDSKEETIKKYGESLIDKQLFILDNRDITMEVRVTGSVIRKTVEVDIEAPVKYPSSFIRELFGKNTTIQVSSKSVMRDQAEFIRTIDVITQVAERITPLQEVMKEYNKSIKKIQDKVSLEGE